MTRGILLDTNALLWLLAGDSALGPSARTIVRAADPVRFSSVSILEVTIKVMLGKLIVPDDVAEAAAKAGLSEATFTSADAQALATRPVLVRHDPFDQMLLAQAESRGLTLLTSDRTLLALDEDWVVDARS